MTKDDGSTPQLPRMTFVYDGKYIGAALKAINAAKSRIMLTELEFMQGDKPDYLRYALVNAKNRGVDVRVLLENSVSSNYHQYDALKKGGVNVRYDGSSSHLHAKLLIVDGNIVLVGSTNFSQSSLKYNHETDIEFNDSTTNAAFTRYFNAIWNQPTRDAETGTCGSGIKCFGDGQYYDNVYPLLTAARQRIDLIMYAISQSTSSSSMQHKMCRALIDAHKRGVDVRVILERLDYDQSVNHDNATAAAMLKQGGVQVRFDPDDVTTHAKMLVVDNRVVVSTNNWSRTGLKYNHEAGVIVQDSGVTNAALKYFQDLWSVSK